MSPKPTDNSAKTAELSHPNAPNNMHEALMLSEALKKKPQHTPVLLRLAQLSEEAGRHEEAAKHLREILRSEPENADAKLELGRALFNMGDVAGAIEQTNAILKWQPDHADALFNLGAIYANLGNTELARKHWDRLFASSPQSEIAQRARVMVARLESQPETRPGNEMGKRTLARQ